MCVLFCEEDVDRAYERVSTYRILLRPPTSLHAFHQHSTAQHSTFAHHESNRTFITARPFNLGSYQSQKPCVAWLRIALHPLPLLPPSSSLLPQGSDKPPSQPSNPPSSPASPSILASPSPRLPIQHRSMQKELPLRNPRKFKRCGKKKKKKHPRTRRCNRRS